MKAITKTKPTRTGQPARYGQPMKRVQIHLTPAHIAKAKEIGGGKVATGIQRLLDEAITQDK